MHLIITNSEGLPKELNNLDYCVEDDLNPLISDDSSSFVNIKSINLFVGANNSGKSRFLRGLIKLNKSSQHIQLLEDAQLLENYIESTYVQRFVKFLNQAISNRLIFSYNSYYEPINSFCTRAINSQIKAFDLVENYHTFQDFFNSINFLQEEILKSKTIRSEYKEVLQNFCENVSILKKNIECVVDNKVSESIYIPTLRSLVKSNFFSSDAFEKTVDQLYDFNKINIYTGLNLYDDVLKIRNSVKEKREGFEKFEAFLSEYFFQNHDVELIADLEEKQLRFYINGVERKIHDIGDGIQQIILLLFPIYTARSNTWVFIEEPETHLHPGLQRIFIETLLKDEFLISKNLTYFFTTHSNHFLDVAIDSKKIGIYQFQKKNNKNFILKKAVKLNKDILDLLGVNTSSVILANSSVWVEGPTDRRYLSKFLKLYIEQKNLDYLKEDIDFAFLEYGGNLIEHYLFDDNFDEDISDSEVREKIKSFSLSNKIYLLSDNDNVDNRTAKGKRRKKFETIENINFKYRNTNVVEIENLLPPQVLKIFLQTLVKDNIEKVEKISFPMKDYERVRLGDFFTKLLIENGFKISEMYKFRAESGTLKNEYKQKLCDLVIESNVKYSSITENNPQLESIVVELYDFIQPKTN